MSSDVLARTNDGPEYLKLHTFGDEVHRADLRECAYRWHRGQWSPLYAFASSGGIVSGLAAEATRCASHADTLEAADDYQLDSEQSFDDSLLLRTIADLAESHGD